MIGGPGPIREIRRTRTAPCGIDSRAAPSDEPSPSDDRPSHGTARTRASRPTCADATPYRRDDALRHVLTAHRLPARIAHLPAPLARLAARTGRVPGLTPYTVDLLTRGVVLDLTRAHAQGWHPAHGFADYRCPRLDR
ncbi:MULTISPECIES: hypothetical protein [unclassified Kitasatospora]|uniref:hypothetical protein n=1 Tax=unclassified Kitasatospora TaxID=2633591 RepID=UPI0033E089D0